MDRQDQMAGEKRVRDQLIDPLLRLGLARPSTVTVAQFEAMQADMARRLAYMSDINLAALADQVAANPGGRDRDRFPIAATILQWAADIQPPGDDASPLIRAVFANGLGRGAVLEGWAPELMAAVRRDRRWPRAGAVPRLRQDGLEAARQLQVFDDRLRRGGELSPPERDWRDRRRAIMARCEDLVRTGEAGS